MVSRISDTKRYTVTYAFGDDCRRGHADAIARIRETTAELRREDRELAFLGATQVVDGTGRLRTLTARYASPTQGLIGLLNCRAMLPACGPPQYTVGETSALDVPDVAIAAGTSG